MIPGGLRIGTPAMTTRGFKEEDFVKVVDIIHKGVQIALKVQSHVKSSKLADFKSVLGESGSDFPEISELKGQVVDWAGTFPAIG